MCATIKPCSTLITEGTTKSNNLSKQKEESPPLFPLYAMDICSSWSKSWGGNGGNTELESRWQLCATNLTGMKQEKHVFHLCLWLFGVCVWEQLPTNDFFKRKRKERGKLRASIEENSLPPPREERWHARSAAEPTFQTETLKTTKNVKLHPVQIITTFCQGSLTPGTADEHSFSCQWKKSWYKLIRNNFSSFL